MPSPTNRRLVATRRTVEGHDEILRTIADLEAHLEVEPTSLSRYVRGLVARLDRLGNLLSAHYAWEETSRLYVEIPEAHPEHAEELAVLAGEHGTTLAAVEWLQTAAGGVEDRDALQRLVPVIRVLIGLLRRHEETEERIIRAVMQSKAWADRKGED